MALRVPHPPILLVAVLGAWACGAGWDVAQAAQPLNRLAGQLASSSESKTARATHATLNRLDLAPPSTLGAQPERPVATPFPVVQRRSAVNEAAASLPSLGTASPGRIMSRPEMLARNFKREGLPLAKLFQSENALLHVGLNPKGKPGLWFVEKLH